MDWTLAGNTVGFGHNIDAGRPYWVGDFTGTGETSVLSYYPGDDNWWLGPDVLHHRTMLRMNRPQIWLCLDGNSAMRAHDGS